MKKNFLKNKLVNKKSAIILSVGFVDIPYIVSIIQDYNDVTIITKQNNKKYFESIKSSLKIITFNLKFLPHPLRFINIINFIPIYLTIFKIKLNLYNTNKNSNIYFLNDFSIPVFFGLFSFFNNRRNKIYFVKTIPYLFLTKLNKSIKKNYTHELLLKILSYVLNIQIEDGNYSAEENINIPWLNAHGYKLNKYYEYLQVKPVKWENINNLFYNKNINFPQNSILFIDTDYSVFPNLDLISTIKNISGYFNRLYKNKIIYIKSHHSDVIDSSVYFKRYLKIPHVYIKEFYPVELIIPKFEYIYFINSSSVLNFKNINRNSLYKLVEFSNKKSKDEFHNFINYLFKFQKI